jgi:geranylgeranyl pyrophosphate synthase
MELSGLVKSTLSHPSAEDSVSRIVEQKLIEPASELDQRPRKNFRAHLVRIGFQLATSRPRLEACDFLGEIIESLHTGSLIIDDIQDNSSVRRGGPCIHTLHGVPLAINAANWLYFSTLDRVAKTSTLSEPQRSQAFGAISDTLMKAHVGQALDLGTHLLSLPPEEVPNVCEKSLQLKSGQLTGLAFQFGAIAAEAAETFQKVIFNYGARFGGLLQKFDDVGNLNVELDSQKHLEDLVLLRPSWVWSCLYRYFSNSDIRAFVNAVQELPSTILLRQFLAHTHLKSLCRQLAEQELTTWISDLTAHFDIDSRPSLRNEIQNLGVHLRDAYN